ncbi:MAG: hypothetical protein QOD32_999 [Pyrinomonadaceae bacterium]|jgi:hypothetical protein|nr:hypothetical protein [Pyrinomonadaceae bacterium]
MKKQLEQILSTSSLPLSKGVRKRVLTRKDNRRELAVIISEDTSAEDLRKAWAAIDRARTQLRRQQGSNMNELHNALLYGYSEMKVNGWSYNAIAMDINYDCIVNLCRAANEIPDPDAPRIESEWLSNTVHMLKALRMKDKEILSWLIPGLKEIKAGSAPWALDSGPVEGLRVRDALRQWRQEQTAERVVVKASPKSRLMPLKELEEKNKEVWQMANNLLNQSFPESLAKLDNLAEKYLKRKMEKSG